MSIHHEVVVSASEVWIYKDSTLKSFIGRRQRTDEDPMPRHTYTWTKNGKTWTGVPAK